MGVFEKWFVEIMPMINRIWSVFMTLILNSIWPVRRSVDVGFIFCVSEVAITLGFY